jgi:diguanylate cyclase (GGDEF)-like protein
VNAFGHEVALQAMLEQAEGLLHRCAWAACAQLLDEIALRADEAEPTLWAVEAAMLRVRLLMERQKPEEAAQWETRALAAAQLSGDAELVLRAELASVAVSLLLGAVDIAWHKIEQVRQGLARLGSVSDRLQYEFYRTRSHAHIPMSHQEEALADAEVSLQAALRLREPRAIAAAQGNVAGRWFALGFRQQADGASSLAANSLGQALVLGEQAVSAADGIDSIWLNLANLNNLCGTATVLRDAARAQAAYERLEQLSQASGVHFHLAHASLHMVRLLQHQGRIGEALSLIEREQPKAEAVGAHRAAALLNLVASRLLEEQADFAAALAAYKRYHAAEQGERRERAEQLSRVSAVREAAEQARAEAEALRTANVALSRQALSDPLTGIANRRHFDEALAATLAEPVPAGQVVGYLALLDADHFKEVNDRHSHSVGDQVLRELAGLLAQQCRASDLAARWGGEEFAVLLRSTDLDQASSVCERLRQTVQQHPWQALAPGLAVTVSLGLVPLRAGADAAATLRLCDEMLYQAKREGRDRVCSGDGAPT